VENYFASKELEDLTAESAKRLVCLAKRLRT